MNKRDHVVATLDAYLSQGYEVKQLGGAAGDDWRELRIILQRPVTSITNLPADFPLEEALKSYEESIGIRDDITAAMWRAADHTHQEVLGGVTVQFPEES